MHFPSWIDRERSALKRAQLRLKYMLSQATLRRYGRTSIHDLAREVGCNHSSIFNAIARGYFTDTMALKIERVVGEDELQWEWLVSPLNVKVSTT